MGETRRTTSTAGGYRWLLSTPSAWPDAEPSTLGLTTPDSADVGDLLAGALHDWRGEGFLIYHRYQLLAAMHREKVLPFEQKALREYDHASHKAARKAFLDCATQIGMALGISRGRAEGMLQEATDLLTRLPQVAERLRDGVINEDLARKIIERTDLIIDDETEGSVADDEGEEPAGQGSSVLAEVDAAIAAELDRGAGAWSQHLVRDLADRIVFRRQPDAVRARREAAKQDRRVWTSNQGDDMGLIAATMSGERIRLSMASVRALANGVCGNDPRTAAQRNSDAVFALLNQLPFECTCPDQGSCTATIVTTEAGAAVVPVTVKAVLNVVADKATVDGRASNPGFMDGHGVISGDYVHDLVADPTTLIRPLGPDDELAVFLDALNNTDDHDQATEDEATTEPDTETETEAAAAAEATAVDTEAEADIATAGPDGDKDAGGDDDPAVSPDPAPGPNGYEPGVQEPPEAPDSDSGPEPPEPGPSDDEPPDPDPDPGPPDPDPDPPQGPQSSGGEPAAAPEPSTEATDSDSGDLIVLPATQPHNPYRPSTALDTFIRIRDAYTLIPGNAHSAFSCDLDHFTEFRHYDPTAGGLTEAANLGAKDRVGHNLKTHGTWVDDLVTDPDGYAYPIFITPERVVIEGRPGPGLDLFPGLARYRFTQPDWTSRRKPDHPRPPSDPPRTRTADKHAQRLAERERLRTARHEGSSIEPPAVRTLIAEQQADAALGDPPF